MTKKGAKRALARQKEQKAARKAANASLLVAKVASTSSTPALEIPQETRSDSTMIQKADVQKDVATATGGAVEERSSIENVDEKSSNYCVESIGADEARKCATLSENCTEEEDRPLLFSSSEEAASEAVVKTCGETAQSTELHQTSEGHNLIGSMHMLTALSTASPKENMDDLIIIQDSEMPTPDTSTLKTPSPAPAVEKDAVHAANNNVEPQSGDSKKSGDCFSGMKFTLFNVAKVAVYCTVGLALIAAEPVLNSVFKITLPTKSTLDSSAVDTAPAGVAADCDGVPFVDTFSPPPSPRLPPASLVDPIPRFNSVIRNPVAAVADFSDGIPAVDTFSAPPSPRLATVATQLASDPIHPSHDAKDIPPASTFSKIATGMDAVFCRIGEAFVSVFKTLALRPWRSAVASDPFSTELGIDV
ncbi:hypothetical protein HDU97_008045 [Phlyctochytrium planicorne]|nr:hypothetical protein HDU97_008045 [Phlyctochytrium planicorne]